MAGTAPPRNVIYFSSNANKIPLAGIANLPYTDVIAAFLVPDGNLNLVGAGGAFDDNLKSNIQTLQNAGKNVLISVGSHQARSITNQNERLSTLDMVIAGVSDFGGGEAFAYQVAAKTKRGAE